MEKEQIAKLALRASELVSGVPADVRGPAFAVVFARLLPEGESSLKSSRGDSPQISQRATVVVPKRSKANPMMETAWDYSRYSPIMEAGSWADRAVVLLAVAEDEFGIAGLTPGEVAEVLKNQMRIRSVYESNVSQSMGAARRWFSRVRDGRGYRYRLTTAGRARLAELLREERGADRSASSR